MVIYLLVASSTADGSEHEAPKVRTQSFSTIGIEAEVRAPGQAGQPSRRRPQAEVQTWTYWIYTYVDGEFCRQRLTTRSEVVAQRVRPFAASSSTLPVCARPAPEPVPAADDTARSFWEVAVLPGPVLRVVPDYAITGKPVYLQITGPQERRFDVDNPIGADVAITAASRYLVDWGDGTTTTTSSQGGPWPNGDVTHTYTDMAPAVTVTVTQLWEASWAAGADRGDLRGLRTSSALTLPVRQLQAVRNV